MERESPLVGRTSAASHREFFSALSSFNGIGISKNFDSHSTE